MNVIVQNLCDLVEVFKVADELPMLLALPIYGTTWAAFVWASAKAVRAVKDALR